jgi:hypothetical protein
MFKVRERRRSATARESRKTSKESQKGFFVYDGSWGEKYLDSIRGETMNKVSTNFTFRNLLGSYKLAVEEIQEAR